MTFGGNTYDININFGDIVKVVTDGKSSVWPECDCCEVLSIVGDSFIAQGYGRQKFYISHYGTTETVEVGFDNNFVVRTDL